MIYIDEFPLKWPKTDNWRYGEVTHLFTDSDDIEELHRFAQSIGLKRSWVDKRHTELIHYDLSPQKRMQALKFGAQLMSSKDMVKLMEKNRNK